MKILKINLAALLIIVTIYLISISLEMISAASTIENLLGVLIILVSLTITTIILNKLLNLKQLISKMKKAILPILFLVSIIFSLSSCSEKIDAGNAGIKVSMYGDEKGVNDITLVTGRVWYNPFTTDIIEFPVFTQTKDYEPFSVNSKDASEFKVDPTLSYFVKADQVPSIYRQYRKSLTELEDGFIRNVVYDAYRIAANSFTSDSLMSNRQKFEDQVQKTLAQTLNKEGFTFQNLTSALTPPPSLKNAIDEKNKAIQTAMTTENQVRQAEADAKILKAKAEGTAESLLIQARAEAEANRLRQQSLNALLIQQQFIEKWNGQLPQYGTVPQIFKNVQ